MHKNVRRVTSFFYFTVASFISIGLIAYASYIFGGYDFLVKGNWGTDINSAYSMAVWYDKYFPSVPFWYPVAGGGVAFIHSYPTFSFALVSIIKRFFSLSLLEAFSWLAYVSVISFASGIYVFVVVKTKRVLMGLLAAIIYLVSPLAWVWLTDWGFYAEAVSHIFVMPTILFWDLFFVYGLSSKTRFSKKRYLVFFFLLLFYFLAFITHFGTGYALLGFFFFYIVGYSLLSKHKLKVIKSGMIAWVFVAIMISFLTLGQTYSFYRYGQSTSLAGVGSGRNIEQISQSTLEPLNVLGITPSLVTSGDKTFPNATKNIRFAGFVSILAGLGILFSFRKKYAFSYALFSVFAIFATNYDWLVYFVVNNIPSPLNVFFSWRWSFIALRFSVSFLAVFGLFSVGDVILGYVFKKNRFYLKRTVSAAIALFILTVAIQLFITLPGSDGRMYPVGARGVNTKNIWEEPGEIILRHDSGDVSYIAVDFDQCQTKTTCTFLSDKECLASFVQNGNDTWCASPISDYFYALGVKSWCEHPSSDPSSQIICDTEVGKSDVEAFWRECVEGSENDLCALSYRPLLSQIVSFPKPFAPRDIASIEWFDKAYKEIQQKNPDARFDYSPYLSGIGMYGPIVLEDTSMSQLYIYTVSSTSLISKYYSQFSSSLFLDDAFYVKSGDYLENITKWFGIDYLFFDSKTDKTVFEESGWNLEEIENDGNPVTIVQAPEERSLSEISNKKRVVVIGDSSRGAYDAVYQLSHYGVLPYDEYVLIQGRTRVDDYSPEELADYDILLLHGYTYNSRSKANDLLTNYLQSGGGVFIDTGWQYISPEWEFEGSEGLSVIPFSSLSWQNFGIRDDFEINKFDHADQDAIIQFNALDYQGAAWGVSTASKSSLSEWATPLVTMDDSVLLARGEKDGGRVVWSGMNVVNHAKQGSDISYDEVSYLGEAFRWLSQENTPNSESLHYERNNPDYVEFSISNSRNNGSTILWKEAYHPDFVAELRKGGEVTRLDVERAGPGWVSIFLPDVSEGDVVTYQYKRPLEIYLAYILALFVFASLVFGLLITFIYPQRNILASVERGVKRRLDAFIVLCKKPFVWLNSTEDNDEDY